MAPHLELTHATSLEDFCAPANLKLLRQLLPAAPQAAQPERRTLSPGLLKAKQRAARQQLVFDFDFEEIREQRRLRLQELAAPLHRRDTDEPDAPLHFDAEVTKQLTCTDCKVHREVPEHFNDFSLDFCPEGGHTVERMLSSYFEGEEVAVTCEKCGAAGAMLWKRLTRPPRVLALHLKRFRYCTFTGGYEKHSASVAMASFASAMAASSLAADLSKAFFLSSVRSN